MAYNPFDFFRRNQKTAFAALTVFVMFTFVLSFGQGDFFQWIPGWLGSFKNRGKEVMAKIDGRKVYDVDLLKHDDGRSLADQFMRGLLAQIAQDTDNAVHENMKAASKPTQDAIQRFLQARQNLAGAQQQQRQMRNLPPQLQDWLQSNIQRARAEKFQAQNSVRLIAGGTGQSAADDVTAAKAAESLAAVDGHIDQLVQNGTFFPIAPGKTNGDRLEFDLWLRKADKLGVTIRPADAPAFVQEALSNLVSPKAWAAVEDSFKTKQGFTRARLEEALANEFRAQTAFSIVFGMPVVTPYETYQVFKEKGDPGLYTVMAVPAENFLDKVAGTPTDAELRDLFDRYKNAEPDPTRETPGFRDPRKLKIAWLEVTGDEPYYKARAEEAYQLHDARFPLNPLGLGPTAVLTAPLTLTLADPQLQAAYANYRSQFEKGSLSDNWSPFRREDDRVLDTSVARLPVATAAFGTTIASTLTRAPFLTPILSARERALQIERNDRARGLAMLLSPGSAVGTGLVGNTVAAFATLPKPLPLEVVRTQLIDGVKKNLAVGGPVQDPKKEAARGGATDDLKAFIAELTRLGAKKDKSEARAYADKFLAERGLKHGGSTEFRDQYAIDEDPGLAVLADKRQRGHGQSDIPVPFGRGFFQARDPRAGLSYYEPQVYPDGGPAGQLLKEFEPTYLTWRTESVEPATPREFAAARPKVEAAWRRQKARELARQAAEEVKKRIDDKLKAENALDQKGKVQQIVSDVYSAFTKEKYGTDLAKADRSTYFFVDRVAPLRIERGGMFDMGGREERVEGFQSANLVRRQLPHPSDKMARDLLDAKDKPRGTTLVEADQANDVFYVAVLVDREDSELPYFEAKGIVEGRTPVAGAFVQTAQAEAVRKAHEKVVGLLKAEFRVTDESDKLKEKPGDAQ